MGVPIFAITLRACIRVKSDTSDAVTQCAKRAEDFNFTRYQVTGDTIEFVGGVIWLPEYTTPRLKSYATLDTMQWTSVRWPAYRLTSNAL